MRRVKPCSSWAGTRRKRHVRARARLFPIQSEFDRFSRRKFNSSIQRDLPPALTGSESYVPFLCKMVIFHANHYVERNCRRCSRRGVWSAGQGWYLRVTVTQMRISSLLSREGFGARSRPASSHTDVVSPETQGD